MSVHDDDDIGSLFKAIGGKNNHFKDFSTQSNALNAQERWPLFKSVGVEMRAAPPPLLPSEKQQWSRADSSVPPPLLKGKGKGLTLGNKIASGLNRLGPATSHPHTSVPAHPSVSQAHAPMHASLHTPPEPATRRASISAQPAQAPSQKLHGALQGFRQKADDSAVHSSHAHETAPAMPKLFGRQAASAMPLAAPAATHAPDAHDATAKGRPGLFAKPTPPAPPEAPAVSAPAKSRLGLFAKSSAPAQTIAAPAQTATPAPSAPSGKKLFGRGNTAKSATPAPQTPAALANRSTGDNLANLFARLDDPPPPPAQPGKKRSLFGKMGQS
jgi:hypothetical protein